MSKPVYAIPLPQRMRQKYVPFDAMYSLCDRPVHLFLPPSRFVLGILSPTLPEQMPLEFMPLEYMGAAWEDGSFDYLRTDNGYLGVSDWSFPRDGRAVCRVEAGGLGLVMDFAPLGEHGVAFRVELANRRGLALEAFYLNSCLRYQSLACLQGAGHANHYVLARGRALPVAELCDMEPMGPRALLLAASQPAELGPAKQAMVDSLMKSRHMYLAPGREVEGGSIVVAGQGGGAVGMAVENPFAFFSRSHGDPAESGCIHAMPLVENLPAGGECETRGVIMWGGNGPAELMENCRAALS